MLEAYGYSKIGKSFEKELKIMKYKLEITEWLQKVIEVEANSKEEAYNIVSDMYRKNEIVLDSSDFIDKEIDFFEEN